MLNSFIRSTGFFGIFCTDSLIISEHRQFSFFSICKLFCIFLTLLYWLGPPEWCWIEVVRNICLVLDLREKESLSLSPLSLISGMFSAVTFQVVEVPLYSWFDRAFLSWMDVEFIRCIFCIYQNIQMAFLHLLIW